MPCAALSALAMNSVVGFVTFEDAEAQRVVGGHASKTSFFLISHRGIEVAALSFGTEKGGDEGVRARERWNL